MKNIAYKFGLASSILFVLAMALAGGVLADGGAEGEGEIQIVNGYQITLIWANPVQLGENPFHLQVSDAQAQPVTHAEIAVSVVANDAEQDVTVGHGEAGHGDTETSHDTQSSSSDSSAHTGMDMPSDTHTPSEGDQLTLTPGEENGEYVGEIVIPEAGDWLVRAHLTIDALPLEVDFPVTVAPAQNGLSILIGFLAVNAVILGAAVILRPRKPAKIQPA